MSAILLLMGLLVLSYLGSFLVSGRAVRGVGLPSGAEYVALGFLMGPQVLGVVERSMLTSFEPIAHVALGWLALVIGIDFGFEGERRVRVGSFLLAVLGTLLTGGAIFGVVVLLLRRFPIVAPGVDTWLLAGGLAAACSETTRHAVRWVVERHQAKGPVASLMGEISHADDIVPLLAVAALFALKVKVEHVPWKVPLYGWLGATIVLGLLLGAIAALLIGRTFTLHTTWGVLFGTSLLAIGVSYRMELAPLAVTFFMGIGIAAVSPHRTALRDAVAATERPVLLPALVLAGASIDFKVLQADRRLVGVVAVAIAARVVAKLVFGGVVRAVVPAARPAGGLVGVGLLSSGMLSMSLGLVVALRFPGIVGDTILVAAAVSAIFGELVAPAALKRALTRAGEIAEPVEAAEEAAVP